MTLLAVSSTASGCTAT